jgi:hypothetical protein
MLKVLFFYIARSPDGVEPPINAIHDGISKLLRDEKTERRICG